MFVASCALLGAGCVGTEGAFTGAAADAHSVALALDGSGAPPDGRDSPDAEGSGVPSYRELEEALRERFEAVAGPHPVSPAAAFLPHVTPETPVQPVSPPAPDTAYADFRLERFDVAVVREHVVAPASTDPTGYAAGAGLLDVDGDGDLDLFLGRLRPVDPPPCVYRNISTRGHVAFEHEPSWCFPQATNDVSGMAIDLERDGIHELVLTGLDAAWLVRFAPGVSVTSLPVGSPGEPTCPLSSGIPFDYDLDGELDLFLPCQVRADIARSRFEFAPRLLRGTGGGGFEAVDPGALGPLGLDMNTLAAAVLDADEDGLHDVVLAVDTFSSPRSRNRLLRPGGVYYRCAPFDPACVYREAPFLPDATTYGSYMGIALLLVDGVRSLYLTDWGYNRLLPMEGLAPWSDIARERAAADGGNVLAWHFSWGVLAEDLDQNGQDDLLVAQGCVPGRLVVDCPKHYDLALTQRADGLFRGWADAVGLPPHSVRDETTGGFGWSSRSWLRGDLDGDGTLELIALGYAGAPRFYRLVETSPTPWCTLVPHPRYVAGFGWGYAIASTEDGPWAERHIQGQMRASPNPWIETRDREGFLRFASGAVVRWTCAGGERVDVREPEWITTEPSAGRSVLVAIEPGPGRRRITGWAFDGEASEAGPFFAEPAAESVILDLPGGADNVLLQVDGRWVPQWISVQSL